METVLSDPLLQEDILYNVVFFLDATAIAQIQHCCRRSNKILSNKNTVKWIASMQKVFLHGELSCIEQLRIAECVTSLQCTLDFEFGSTCIEPRCRTILDEFAVLLQKHTTLHVKLDGHVGIEAPKGIAVPFSRKRAESVANYLVKYDGINNDRFTCTGFGKSKVLLDALGIGNMHAGGDKNRRVEIYLVHNGIEFPTRDANANNIDCSNKDVPTQLLVDSYIYDVDTDDYASDPEDVEYFRVA